MIETIQAGSQPTSPQLQKRATKQNTTSNQQLLKEKDVQVQR